MMYFDDYSKSFVGLHDDVKVLFLDFNIVLIPVDQNCVKFKIPAYVWNYETSTIIFLRDAVQQSG